MTTSTRQSHQLPHGREGLPVTINLATAVGKLARSAGGLDAAVVLQALEISAPDPPISVRCLNPSCKEMCEWTGASGRPKKFCSDACRQQHEKVRQRLETEVEIMTGAIQHPDTTPAQRKLLVSARAHRLFVLARYPDVRGPRAASRFRPGGAGRE